MSRLALLALAVAFAACTPPSPGPGHASRPAPDPDAGLMLSDAQRARLDALGLPLALLRPGDGWTADRVTAERFAPGAESYAVRWRRADGACIEVNGATDGIGGPEFPIESVEVRLSAMPGAPPVRLYRASDDPAATSAEVWGPGTVVSDFIEVGTPGGPMFVTLRSAAEDGCTALTLERVARLAATLHVAGIPAGDDLGAFAPAPDLLASAALASGSAEQAARDTFTPWAEEGATVQVETLDSGRDWAVVLVTLGSLGDDSIRAERVRLRYERRGGMWRPTGAERQVRCHPGRGHTDWGPGLCT